jgi:hypothetical protein
MSQTITVDFFLGHFFFEVVFFLNFFLEVVFMFIYFWGRLHFFWGRLHSLRFFLWSSSFLFIFEAVFFFEVVFIFLFFVEVVFKNYVVMFLGSAQPASIYRNVCSSVCLYGLAKKVKKSTQPLLRQVSSTCVRTAFYCVAVIFYTHTPICTKIVSQPNFNVFQIEGEKKRWTTDQDFVQILPLKMFQGGQ